MLHGPAFCGPTELTQRVDWPAQNTKDGQKYALFLFYGPDPQGILMIVNYEHSN